MNDAAPTKDTLTTRESISTKMFKKQHFNLFRFEAILKLNLSFVRFVYPLIMSNTPLKYFWVVRTISLIPVLLYKLSYIFFTSFILFF